jgi:nucleotide-binding universal stress UspA family protein
MEIEIKKILCAVDFSDTSENALDYAVSFAAALKAQLEVLHALELPFLPSYSTSAIEDMDGLVGRVKEECSKRLAALVEKHRRGYAGVTHRVVVGTPAMEIIAAAKEGKFDLVVVGTQGRTGLKHMFIGSVAEKVVRKAPCPVLTVKKPGEESD